MTAHARRPRRLSRADRHARRAPARIASAGRRSSPRSRCGRAGPASGCVVTPIFEHIEVVQKLGSTTDAVRKEMYDFADKGGRHLALRADGTASVARAFAQHQPATPWKVWYVAPNFRYERPQKGRYRQHWQVGVEVLGVDDPTVDVEVIALAHGFYRDDLGLRQTPAARSTRWATPRPASRYREVLLAYWRDARRAARRRDGARRGEPAAHPRLQARRLAGHDRGRAADRRLPHRRGRRPTSRPCRQGLHALGIDFEIAPRLVRGLDYYTGTTFEFQSDALDAAQNAIGGGGRYDGLVEQMGGKPTPGIGFGIGIERVLIVCDAEGVFARARAVGRRVRHRHRRRAGERDARRRAARASGSSAERAYGNRSMKKQWGAADRAGARWGVLLAPRELAEGKVGVKELASGEQVDVKRRRSRGVAADERGRERLMMRTHRAGDLRAEHVGAEVVVCGWVAHRRDHGGVVFLDVRDTAGLVQVVVDPEQAGCEAAHRVRNEWVLRVEGDGAAAARGHGQRRPADRRDRGRRDRGRGAERVGAAAVPARRARRHRRGAAPAPPLPRPAARADAAQPARARRGQPRDARGDARRRTSSRSRRRC